ncbi:uncharacterized protein LOC126754564 isoform X1 [Bactrocera neohumeralis]|uniref:uncharacterized protein LOC126754564 isoform X1 n=1 Tax=Bactrocera neohumeralis TaxID=98809 RepID=UPI002165B1D0|nr:uncharacterized protein LOC126754564 isoform X1 [Bactrocera neohumeralis]
MPRRSEKSKLIAAICEKYLQDILMLELSDDDEQEEVDEQFRVNMLILLNNRRSAHFGVPKSNHWERNVLKHFDENRFCQMMRLNQTEFAYLLNLIKDDNVFRNDYNAAQLSIDTQLKIVLFRLGSSGEGLSVRKVASLFGIGDGGTIQIVTRRVFNAIINLKQRFLYWPDERERLKLIAATEKEMPGCVGYIDGSEIKLAEAPVRNHEIFFSRKRQYSVKIQVICDHRLRIRQLTLGYPGSVHDAKMFSGCLLSKHPNRFLLTSQWIAGDSAYPLKPFLVTPFRQNSTEYSREERENFDKYFSKYHVRIENCFGALKEKFSSLKELKFRLHTIQNKRACNEWIMVCCILHNIFINFNNEYHESSVEPSVNLLPSTNLRHSLLNFIQNHPIV